MVRGTAVTSAWGFLTANSGWVLTESFPTPHLPLAPQVLVLRLRDSIIQMGEELEKAAESEARERENSRYYQRRMEEMKADMDELVQRELESSRRRMELVRGCCSRGLGSPMATGGLLQTPHNPWVGVRAPEKWFSVRCFVCSGSGDGAVPCAGTPWVLGYSSGRKRELLCIPLQPQTIEPKLSLRTLMFPFSVAGLGAWTVPLLHVFLWEGGGFARSSHRNAVHV